MWTGPSISFSLPKITNPPWRKFCAVGDLYIYTIDSQGGFFITNRWLLRFTTHYTFHWQGQAEGREYTSSNSTPTTQLLYPKENNTNNPNPSANTSLSFISILKESYLYFKSLVLSKKTTLIYHYDMDIVSGHLYGQPLNFLDCWTWGYCQV